MRFFGIDLAFKSKNGSGICVLDEIGALKAFKYVYTDADIFEFIKNNCDEINILAIDAPLVVPNETRQRACEKLVGNLYGQYEASCHSSNKNNDAGKRGPALLEYLKQKTLPLAVTHDATNADDNNWPTIEVYPHPAHIELFQLEKTLKYKKGSKDEKRTELRGYIEHLNNLARFEPALQVTTVEFLDSNDLDDLKTLDDVKCREDMLDSLFCAYSALYLWHHRDDARYWIAVKGEESNDFITIPRRLHSHTGDRNGVVTKL